MTVIAAARSTAARYTRSCHSTEWSRIREARSARQQYGGQRSGPADTDDDKEQDMAEKSGLSAEEREAVKQRAAELRAQEKAGKNRAAGQEALREAIAALPDDDRALAEGIDRIVTEVAPQLFPKTWYGFPSYADENGKVVVFFKPASKFTSRYATLGFEEAAKLDDGDLWVTSFAVLALTPETERTIADHVRKAAG
jgi:uncharacterized protein YdhG (YjbR/CyaY superfamily)